MPRRPFKITITLDKTALPTVAVAAGDTIPDLSQRFTLKYQQNYLGTNHAVLGVNSKGLLQSTNNGITSGTATLATNIGALAGAVTAVNAAEAIGPALPQQAAPTCLAGQTYNFIIFPEDISSTPAPIGCDLNITGAVVSMGAGNPAHSSNSERMTNIGRSQSGIFFRRDIPYLLTIRDKSANVLGEWLAYSPDQSEVEYVPTAATVFANSQTNFTFSDGILTQVDESTDGEINGFVQIPTNVITGYTTALGNVFGSLNTAKSNRTSSLADQQAYLLATVKLQACQAAIAANDPTKKTGADQAAAVAAIKTACQ